MATLAPSFLTGSSSFLQATSKPIISRMSSKFSRIRPGAYELLRIKSWHVNGRERVICFKFVLVILERIHNKLINWKQYLIKSDKFNPPWFSADFMLLFTYSATKFCPKSHAQIQRGIGGRTPPWKITNSIGFYRN